MRNKISFITISLITTLAFALRLYKINNPIGDWHSWRQADTASVTKEFVKHKVNLLLPTYHDLSSIPSGQPNPNGYRMVEFPIYNAITAKSYLFFQHLLPDLNFDLFHRLTSVVISLGSLVYLFLIVKNLSGLLTANLAAFFFAILPYNVYYSRTILPEIPLVFFTLAFIYHFIKSNYWLSFSFLALSLLTKPYALVLALPLLFYAIQKQKIKVFTNRSLYLLATLSVLPYIAWRLWIKQFPSGIPAYLWLLNSNNIRFKGSFFHWIFAERIGNLILGYWGLVLFGLGLLHQKIKSSNYFYLLWFLSLCIYMTIFATGNVQHDYYQVILIPIISIFLAKGSVFLLNLGKKNPIAYLLLITSTVFMLAFSWFRVRGYFNINHPEIINAGTYVDQNTPNDAKVIAPYMGDTAFLYQTNRSGWPIGGDIQDKIKLGATHYVTTSQDDEANHLIESCQLVTKTDHYIVINLQGCQL
mgnify:FL=1|jgi:hypothetical protein